MLPYLLLTAALGMGQPDSVPPAGTPAPSPRGTLTLESDPPALQTTAAQQPAPAPPAAAPAPPKPVEFTVPALPAPPAPPAAPAAAAPTYPDRWLLMKELQGTWLGYGLDGSRTQIYGWFDFNYTFSSVGHTDLPESFNYRGNEPTLEQLWVRISRPVITGTTTNGTSYVWPTPTTAPTFGFQSDWIIGTDYRFTLPQKGILNDQLTDRTLYNSLALVNNAALERQALTSATPGQVLSGVSDPRVFAPNLYGVDPVQFFGEAYFPTIGRGLDVKLGRFYTPYGVESLEAATMGNNAPNALTSPVVSHSYIFSNGSPFTHTGALATLTVTPVWTVQFGVVLGSDLFFHPADRATGIFTLQYTQPQGTQSISRNVVKFTTVSGPARFDDNHSVQHINIYDVVWTHYFNPNFASNLETLYGFEHNVPGSFLSMTNGETPKLGFVNWAGVAGYLTYIFTPRFTGCVRLELFDDPQGVRTSSAEDPFADRTKGLYQEVTVAGSWKLRKGLYVMPEVRYDYNYDSAPFGTTVDHPFDGHHGMLTAGSSLILRW